MAERIRRTTRVIRDIWRLNHAFVTSRAFRATVQREFTARGFAFPTSRIQLDEQAAAPSLASPYLGLTPVSVALSAIGHDDTSPRLNLVVPDYEPGAVFAGVHTAVKAAAALARELGIPVRLLILSEARRRDDVDAIRADFATRTESASCEVVARPDLVSLRVSPDDVWMVTHWTTAHAAVVACRSRTIDPRRVVYLVQDHEPGFVPMSSDRALASATYREGFLLAVNSTPVADSLRQHEGVDVEPALTFSPGLDVARLAQVASQRDSRRPRRVLFYGRPSKPRNMFSLGVAALRVAAHLSSEPIEWVSAGEPHDDIDLSEGQTLRSLGTLSWDAYYREISRAGVMLSLQASPHPSHPPLEAALSGAIAVTNDVDGTRSDLLPNLVAVDPDPRLIGEAIVMAFAMPNGAVSDLSTLGLPLDEVVAAIAKRLQV